MYDRVDERRSRVFGRPQVAAVEQLGGASEFTVVNYLCLLSLGMNTYRYFDFLYYSPLSACPFNTSYSCNNGPSVSQSSHPLLEMCTVSILSASAQYLSSLSPSVLIGRLV